MRTIGTIAGLYPDGSVTLLTLETAHGEINVAAETRLLLSAIEDAFGQDWKGAEVEVEHDGMMLYQFWPLEDAGDEC
jgi:6-phosphogluconolactonase (cycloisomerase 2 family)